jgi:hypothetical protein
MAVTPTVGEHAAFIGIRGRRAVPQCAQRLRAAAGVNDGTPVPSRAAIANKFGLSKTQVGNVMATGERLGFFTLDGTGVPAATQHLRDTYASWISIELAFYARHMQPA